MNLMDDPELIQDFVAESTELLEKLDEDLVLLESSPQDQEILNRIFRAVHTIKGTSAFLGYEELVRLCHATEEVLNKLRKGEQIATVPVLNALLDAMDAIRLQVKRLQSPEIASPDVESLEKRLESLFDEEDFLPADAPPKATPDIQKSPAAAGTAHSTPADQTLRIRMSNIDEMINLVGELVIERNRLVQLYQNSGQRDESLAESIERLSQIISELQMSVLKVRMIPIEKLFRKFPRVVRNLAHQLGKKVVLHISGEDSELDKSMVDELHDPLVHILRNAVYHGIESPKEREAAGKPQEGHIFLAATHESNQLLIRIRDDGRGLQLDRIAQKALQKGLVSEQQLREMQEEELLHIIFQPGFSTAEQADEVSGRGVGLDVVHNQIKKLNGIIEVHNFPGQGCEFILKLPLTLAIIQALLVESAGELFAVPLSSVIEILKIDVKRIHHIGRERTILHRGSVLRLLHLGEALELGGNGHRSGTSYVLVIGVAEKRYGLMVERLHGQEEVVIKPLAEGMPTVAGLAGSLITGDGKVRFIVEPSQLI
ncbi:MAG TPA: chemotaxis protein CheA [Bacteroidetes bacterium]|nr:chemotaxis protein CheA [Bacteroidota bacterium]